MKIMMNPVQTVRFKELVKESDHFLEFGSGGSTVFAAEHCKTVVSIESDFNWIQVVKKLCSAKFIHVDIGSNGNFGYPSQDCPDDKKREYSRSLFSSPNLGELDTVFIDGRFRVACALQTYLLVKQPERIIFDDFMNRQDQYGEVLNWFDIVESCETMAVLKKKEEKGPLDLDVRSKYERIPQ